MVVDLAVPNALGRRHFSTPCERCFKFNMVETLVITTALW
jgi:hypothetical protein